MADSNQSSPTRSQTDKTSDSNAPTESTTGDNHEVTDLASTGEKHEVTGQADVDETLAIWRKFMEEINSISKKDGADSNAATVPVDGSRNNHETDLNNTDETLIEGPAGDGEEHETDPNNAYGTLTEDQKKEIQDYNENIRNLLLNIQRLRKNLGPSDVAEVSNLIKEIQDYNENIRNLLLNIQKLEQNLRPSEVCPQNFIFEWLSKHAVGVGTDDPTEEELYKFMTQYEKKKMSKENLYKFLNVWLLFIKKLIIKLASTEKNFDTDYRQFGLNIQSEDIKKLWGLLVGEEAAKELYNLFQKLWGLLDDFPYKNTKQSGTENPSEMSEL